MQIQLKQAEIEAALKLFISQQGINLAGKHISVVFTSGRKDNGISAEMTIEDAKSATTTQVTFDTVAEPMTEPVAEEVPSESQNVKTVSLFSK